MKQVSTPGPNNAASADRTTTGPPADSAGGRLGVGSEQERPWHTLSADEVAGALQADATSGLTDGEAARRREQFGPNALAAAKGRSALAILVDQFESLIVVLLLVVTVVAFALGDNVEAVAVLVVVVLNAAVGFLTEWKAEQALTALQQQAVPTAHVVRGGEEHEIPAAELVPGDIVLVAAGSRVPADGRVIECVRLQVAEAALTGESLAVTKTVEPIPDDTAPLGDRRNMAYLGTAVTDGRGRLLVTATGVRTEVGRIGKLIEVAGARDTPLERKLAQLGHALIGVVLALCAVIVLAGWLRGHEFFYMLKVGISLAIAAVPEGLPAVATMTLALGMKRMARMHALVRRLPAVETLGSTTVICTDKTGTLTRDEMTVRVLQLGTRRVDVSGAGYARAGEFRTGGGAIDVRTDAHLTLALRVGALCSDATLDLTGEETVVLGDPTEGALLVAALKAGMSKDDLEREYPRLSEVPFSSESKRMVTVHRTPSGRAVAYVKGAPAVVADASVGAFTGAGVRAMTTEIRQRVLADNHELAGRALRVLALGYKDLPDGYREEDLTGGFVFVGLVGMIDPLRDEAKAAIETCRVAGIRTVMITGDQEATAAEIGRQLGLDRDLQGRPLRTAHGRELADLDAAGWQKVAAEVGVFTRVSPEHKLRIVEALQAAGEVVAMTGDGVNDAPALKQADIGIAMGVKGTEVAKEAAAMVVTDDNFATIVGAVEQGRGIYANILRFVHYLFSCNLAEILVVFIALMVGWPLPLVALQILWLNMITDVFPAMALALEPSNPDAMKRPPRDPGESLVTPRFLWLITWQALLLSGVTLLAFAVGMRWYGAEGSGLRHATTLAFMTLALVQVFHTFNARSQRRSAFTARLFTNAWLWAAVATCLLLQLAAVYTPLLQTVLHTTPLSAADWVAVLTCSLAPVGVVELVKFGRRASEPRARISRARGSP
ncbi:cation-translocating P-type ATPase [Frigoriglobus tundricola]|uniref:Calcium-translocating P-type ATPase, PMCA-type n=1 Tax=Frigoriglobus tundricola TaxID=2774151 RepID=A0A6M5YMU8_9BACT|nr:HAD-IC family P-type ATPase [Frigoriglobus tundricola]QJW94680.1 Calcium-translocating P-type ATPase, PMCA-type [Frigoriglobus tundricola]